MKVYISADMEGIAGISHREEVDPENSQHYPSAQERMTDEVVAACEGALDAGATEIWVKDAHWHGRNILFNRLPKEVRLIRGWSGHPYMMVQELDSSVAALAMIGYHSKAGSGGNPLAHTLSSRIFSSIEINQRLVSEFQIYSYAALLERVPTVFVSGDKGLCQEVKAYHEQIETVVTMEGKGASNWNIHPQLSCNQIRTSMKKALSKDFHLHQPVLPSRFEVNIHFKAASDAYKKSFYPGAALKTDHTLRFETEHYFEVLRLLQFTSA